jgi:hypothetical protein
MKKHPREKRIRLIAATILLVTVATLSVASAVAFQFYLRTVAENILDSWLKTEAVAIQEGNLLSALSNNRRVVLSSQLVRSVALIDDKSKSYGPEVLAEFGLPSENISRIEIVETGKIDVTDVGLFHVTASYRFPESDNMVVRFDLQPVVLFWTYLGLNSILVSVHPELKTA